MGENEGETIQKHDDHVKSFFENITFDRINRKMI